MWCTGTPYRPSTSATGNGGRASLQQRGEFLMISEADRCPQVAFVFGTAGTSALSTDEFLNGIKSAAPPRAAGWQRRRPALLRPLRVPRPQREPRPLQEIKLPWQIACVNAKALADTARLVRVQRDIKKALSGNVSLSWRALPGNS